MAYAFACRAALGRDTRADGTDFTFVGELFSSTPSCWSSSSDDDSSMTSLTTTEAAFLDEVDDFFLADFDLAFVADFLRFLDVEAEDFLLTLLFFAVVLDLLAFFCGALDAAETPVDEAFLALGFLFAPLLLSSLLGNDTSILGSGEAKSVCARNPSSK